jgi:hypothetical protein
MSNPIEERIQYFAVALNAERKIGQLLVTRENGKTCQEWTGKVYRSQRDAMADIEWLNCGKKSEAA